MINTANKVYPEYILYRPVRQNTNIQHAQKVYLILGYKENLKYRNMQTTFLYSRAIVE